MDRPTPGRFPSLGSGVHVLFSTRDDGDFHIEQPRDVLDATRRAFVDLPWSQPDEVHGIVIGVVERPGHLDGAVADALVTDCADSVVGIWVGDCAPVALVSAGGRIAGVHAGWRGIEAGVLAAAVSAVRRDADEPVEAVLGPCIHACCYEFGHDDLARMVARFGRRVVGTTVSGAPALDVPAAVAAALAEVGVEVVDQGGCTSCHAERWFSHRARAERGRQVMAVWRSAA
ncbi:MAG: polyphenol oxidase family protein [Ilumatobacteraceae bacterium]